MKYLLDKNYSLYSDNEKLNLHLELKMIELNKEIFNRDLYISIQSNIEFIFDEIRIKKDLKYHFFHDSIEDYLSILDIYNMRGIFI